MPKWFEEDPTTLLVNDLVREARKETDEDSEFDHDVDISDESETE